jgi:serine/threonine protein kinase
MDHVLEREQGQPLDLTRFLCVAIGLASGLGQVHRQGLIHKDISLQMCSNVWLIGFGIASWLPREHQPPVPLEIIAGTLAYMAPEQTGRTARWMPAAISTLWASPCTRCLPVTCRFWRRPPGVGPLSHCARAGAA